MAHQAAEERPTLQVIVASNVRFERLARGWSQEKVARHAELSADTIRVIENARDPERSSNALRLDTLERIAAALGVEPARLLEWEPVRTRAFLHASAAHSPGLAVIAKHGGGGKGKGTQPPLLVSITHRG